MDIKLRYKEGHALAISENGNARFIKLILKDEVIEILEKVNPSKLENSINPHENLTKNKLATESSFAFSKLPVERTVEIAIDSMKPNSSLGISIKGGTDFNLPILISKIIAGERADKTNQLFVGDAILELNGKSLLGYTHRAAVDTLQSAGSHVTIRVRHLPHAATVLLNEGFFKKELSIVDDNREASSSSLSISAVENHMKIKEESPVENSNHVCDKSDSGDSAENIHKLPTNEYSYLTEKYTDKRFSKDNHSWIVGLRISLQYAYLSVFQYKRVSNQENYDSFIVKTIDGHSTGIISFKDSNVFHFWKEAIKFNINALLINSINKMNRSMRGDDQIHFMGWLFCIGYSKVKGAHSCKRYYESEYANIEDIKKEIKHLNVPTGIPQCISRKQKFLENSPSNKWCYLFSNLSQKSSVEHSNKQKLNNHSHANLSELCAPPSNPNKSFQEPKYSKIDKPMFLVLRGIHLYLFFKPPVFLGDWFTPTLKAVISRTIINQIKKNSGSQVSSSVLNDDGMSSKHQASSESTISQINIREKDIHPTEFVIQIEQTLFDCIVDCPADLIELETVWVKVNYHAVCHIKVDTFKCSYQSIDCILCLDFDYGIKLINETDGIRIWHFKFYQLKASSDDGDNRLRLIFTENLNNETRIIEQILHCHNLPTLLISIQSFLTAKLGQVDPHYFDR